MLVATCLGGWGGMNAFKWAALAGTIGMAVVACCS